MSLFNWLFKQPDESPSQSQYEPMDQQEEALPLSTGPEEDTFYFTGVEEAKLDPLKQDTKARRYSRKDVKKRIQGLNPPPPNRSYTVSSSTSSVFGSMWGAVSSIFSGTSSQEQESSQDRAITSAESVEHLPTNEVGGNKQKRKIADYTKEISEASAVFPKSSSTFLETSQDIDTLPMERSTDETFAEDVTTSKKRKFKGDTRELREDGKIEEEYNSEIPLAEQSSYQTQFTSTTTHFSNDEPQESLQEQMTFAANTSRRKRKDIEEVTSNITTASKISKISDERLYRGKEEKSSQKRALSQDERLLKVASNQIHRILLPKQEITIVNQYLKYRGMSERLLSTTQPLDSDQVILVRELCKKERFLRDRVPVFLRESQKIMQKNAVAAPRLMDTDKSKVSDAEIDKMFFHVLGDSFGLESGLEGSHSRVYFQLIDSFFAHKIESGKRLSQAEQNIWNCIKRSMQVNSGILDVLGDDEYSSHSPQAIKEVSQYLEKAILKGEFPLVLYGGWSSKEEGHAILYEITKQHDGKYTFKVINTGDGIDYHKSKIVGSKQKFDSSFCICDINLEDLVSDQFVQMFLEQRYKSPPKDVVTYQDVYEGLLPLLKGRVDNKTPTDPELLTAQRSGTCTFSSLQAWMTQHLTKREYKQFVFELQSAILRNYIAVLKDRFTITDKNNGIDLRQAILLSKAISRYSRFVQKLYNQKRSVIFHAEYDKEIEFIQEAKVFVAELKETLLSKERATQSELFTNLESVINNTAEKDPFAEEPKREVSIHHSSLSFHASSLKNVKIDNVSIANVCKKSLAQIQNAFNDEDYDGVIEYTKAFMILLPSPYDDFWKGLAVDQRREIVDQISSIQKLFFKSHFYHPSFELLPPISIACMGNALCIMQTLLDSMPELSKFASEAVFKESDLLFIMPEIYYSITDPVWAARIAQILEKQNKYSFGLRKNYAKALPPNSPTNEVLKYDVRSLPPIFVAITNWLLDLGPSEKRAIESKHPRFFESSIKDQVLGAYCAEDILPQQFLNYRSQVLMMRSMIDGIHSRLSSSETPPEDIRISMNVSDNEVCAVLEGTTASMTKPRLHCFEQIYSFQNTDIKKCLELQNREIYSKTHISNLITQDPHDLNIDISKEGYFDLTRIFAEPSLQVAEALRYFQNHKEKLADPDYQNVFIMALCHNGKLANEVRDCSDLVRQLTLLIRSSYIQFERSNNIQTCSFLLRLDLLIQGIVHSVGDSHPFKDLEQSWQMISLTIDQLFMQCKTKEEKSLVSELRCLAADKMKMRDITADSVTKVLHARLFHAANKTPSMNDYGRNDNVKSSMQQLAPSIASFFKENVQEAQRVLNSVFRQFLMDSDSNSVWKDVRWNIDMSSMPVIFSERKDIMLNMLTGDVSVLREDIEFDVPGEILHHPAYKAVFADRSVKARPVTINLFSLVDSFGDLYKVSRVSRGQIEIERLIEGKWHRYIPYAKFLNGAEDPDLSIQSKQDLIETQQGLRVFTSSLGSRWLTEHSNLWFDSSSKTFCLYSSGDSQLVNAKGSIHNRQIEVSKKSHVTSEILKLANIYQGESPLAQEFAAFESPDFIELWMNSSTHKPQELAFPRFGMSFSAHHYDNTVVWKTEDKGVQYTLIQGMKVSTLEPFSGYIVLGNSKGQKLVRIPNQKNYAFQKRSLDFPVIPDHNPIKDAQEQTYFEYRLSESGNLIPTTLGGLYHLTSIYLAQGDYENAMRCINQGQASLSTRPFSIEERESLTRIWASRNGSKDISATAVAIRLKAYSIALRNYKDNDSEWKEQKAKLIKDVLQDEITLYLNQLSSAGEAKLSKLDELFLLELVRPNEVVQARIKELKTGNINAPIDMKPVEITSIKELLKTYLNKVTPQDLGGIFEQRSHSRNYQGFEKLYFGEYSIRPIFENILFDFTKMYRDIFLGKIHPDNRKNLIAHLEYALRLDATMQENERKSISNQSRYAAAILLNMLYSTDLRSYPYSDKLQSQNNLELLCEASRNSVAVPSISYGPGRDVQALSRRAISPESEELYGQRESAIRNVEVKEQPVPMVVELPIVEKIVPVERYFNIQSVDPRGEIEKYEKFRGDFQKSLEEVGSSSEFAQKWVQSMREGLEAFQSKTSEPVTKALIKEEVLDELCQVVEEKLNVAKEKAEDLSAQIEVILNSIDETNLNDKLRFESGLRSTLSISDALLAFARGNMLPLIAINPSIQTRLDELHTLTSEYLQTCIVRDKLDKALVLTHKIQNLKVNPKEKSSDEIFLLTQELKNQLELKRFYDAAKFPAFLVLEYCAELTLRREQVKVLEQYLAPGSTHLVTQLIMGFGKTNVLLPLLALLKATPDTISSILLPEALFSSMSDTLRLKMGEAFNQHLIHLPFNRTLARGESSWDYLKNFSRELQRAQESLNCVVFTPQIKYSLINALVEGLEDCAIHAEATEEDIGKIELLSEVLYKLRVCDSTFADEIDQILSARLEHNYPKGIRTALKKAYMLTGYLALETMVESQDILQDASISTFHALRKRQQLPEIEAPSLTKEHYTQTILPKLAKKMVEKLGNGDFGEETARMHAFYQTLDPTSKQVIEEYFSGSVEAYEKVKTLEDPIIKDILAIIMYEVTSILPNSLLKQCRRHYGFSDDSSCWIARPYKAANKPNTTFFGNQYEALTYTILTYFSEGVPKSLVQNILDDLKGRALGELSSNDTLTVQDTKAFAELNFLVHGDPHLKDINLLNLKESDIDLIQKLLSRDLRTIKHVLKEYASEQITIYEKKISSNAQQLVDSSNDFNGATGTPSNATTYHPSLHVSLDFSSDIEALFNVWEKSTKGRSHIDLLDDSTTDSLVNSIVSRFENSQDKRVLIDSAGSLRAIDNVEEFVQFLLSRVHQKNPSITGIAYRNKQGEEFCIEIGKKLPVRLIESSIRPENRLTIIEEEGTTGTNILQAPDAIADKTIAKDESLRDFNQSNYRMRGIAKEQSIDFLIPSETQTTIATVLHKTIAKEPVTYFDLVKFCTLNQLQVVEQENFHAAKQKMDNVIKQIAFSQILHPQTTASQKVQIHKAFRSFFIKNTEDRPFDSYGRPVELVAKEAVIKNNIRERMDKMTSIFNDSPEITGFYVQNTLLSLPSERVEALQKTLIQQGINSPVLSHEALQTQEFFKSLSPNQYVTIALILLQHDLKKCVDVSTLSELLPASDTDVGNEVEIEEESKQEVQTEKQQQVQQEQERGISAKKFRFMPFFEWKQSQVENSIYEPQLGKEEDVKFFNLKDLLLYYTSSQVLGHALSEKISFSYNLLPFSLTHEARSTHPNRIKPFEEYQKPINYILVRNITDSDFEVVLHDPQEMELVIGNKDNYSNTILVDSNANVLQLSKNVDRSRAVLDSPEFKQIQVQIKFLNGEVIYSPDEIKSLEEWLRANDARGLAQCFINEILRYKPQNKINLAASTLGHLFTKLGVM